MQNGLTTEWGKGQIGTRNAGECNTSKYYPSPHPWKVLGPPVNFAKNYFVQDSVGRRVGRK